VQTRQPCDTADSLSVPGENKKADGLSPFRLLNRHAMAGSFSVQNVLEAEDVSETANIQQQARLGSKSDPSKIDQDPIAMGFINLPSAMQLYDR
jgi:hypothetical protein